MSDNSNPNRLNDAALDADLSVLGDDGKKPGVPRLGDAPAPAGEGTDASGMAGTQKDASVNSVGETGETATMAKTRASKDAIRDVAEDQGKG